MQTGLIDLHESDYHANPAISKSGLDRINQSPLHYKTWLESPDEPTDAMLFGTAAHRLILEPSRFYETCVVAPECDRRTKAGKETWEAFTASNDGKLVLKADQFATLKGMADSWRSHPLYEGTHNGSKYETSAFWQVSDISCKARPDILHRDGLILDLKTTDSARESDFQNTIARYRYHVQAAWYLDGLGRATGEKFESFVFIAIEKKPPYAVAVYFADSDMINRGRRAYTEDFATYAKCLETGVWPAYPTEVRPIQLPAWAL